MAKLPFVVEPKRKPIAAKIGSEDSGIIDVERRGYLSAGEKAFVQQVQQFDNGSTDIITLSRKVAREYHLGLNRAYALVLSVISGSSGTGEDAGIIKQIELDFADDLTNVVKGLSAAQAREELVMAACLLKYRVDPDFEISEVAELHPDIISGLAKLYREEEAKSVEAFNAESGEDDKEGTEVSVEEIEKKPNKKPSSRSKITIGD